MFKRALCLLAIGSQLFSQAASAQAAAALVPAYIYPEPGDWQPLYTQFATSPGTPLPKNPSQILTCPTPD